MDIRIFTFNLFQEHTMVVWDKGPGCVIIDPGCHHPDDYAELYAFLDENGLVPEAMLLTHGHLDHCFGVKTMQEKWDIPAYMSPADADLPEKEPFAFTPIHEGDELTLAGIGFKVIETPGHTPGSVCLLVESEKVLFSGDTLFAGTIGRTDFAYSDYDDEIRSIMDKIIWLDPDIEIFPGHGPSSTIGVERSSNPFLEPFNEPEELDCGALN